LPEILEGGSVIPYGDTFLIIGGNNPDRKGSKNIIIFDIEEENWKYLPQTLQQESLIGSAFVPDNYLYCT
jgi:hypothetical protein